MSFPRLHLAFKSTEPATPHDDSDIQVHNESWLFRILSRATAFGEVLPQRPSRHNEYNPTIQIVNLLSRDLSGALPKEDSDKTPAASQLPAGCSIQRWLAFRASTASSEQTAGSSLAGPLERKGEKSSLPPPPPPPPPPLPPPSDFVSVSLDQPSASASTAAAAELSIIEGIPQLTFREKLSLIIKEFGPLAKENEEERLLAEADASFFQDVAILGVVHLTTHRLTFHASLLNTRPDLASSKEIIQSGYVDIRCGFFNKRHRVWMELTHDMITTYRSSAEDERVRPLRTLLLSSIKKIHPSDSSHPLQVRIDSISLRQREKNIRKDSSSFFHRLRRLSRQQTDMRRSETIQETELSEIMTHVIESGTAEAAVSWRKELLAALYLFSKRRNLLLGNINQPDTSENEVESEHGVRISIPLERIKTYRTYQWDFAAVLQVDISMLTGTSSTTDNIPSGSPLLPKIQLTENSPTATEFSSKPEAANRDDTDGQYIPDDTRFQFGLAKASGPWLQFGHLVEVAKEKRTIASNMNDSPVTVDFGTLTFVEDRVPLFDSNDNSDRQAIAIDSREREVRRLFGLPDELEIWIVKCCRYRRTIRTTGLLVISSKFICFWSRLVGTSDIRMRYHTEDLCSASASRSSRFGFGLTLGIAGHTNLVLDFSHSDVRDEALQRLQPCLVQNSTNIRRRVSSLGKESRNDSSFFLTSSPDASTSEHSSFITKGLTSASQSTALLSPISRTVSQLRSRTFPPALLPHLVKPINIPANILPFGISPRHFVLLTIGSRGDVQPYIALGKGLLSLGHRVTLVTHEEYKSWIEGFEINHRSIAGDPGALMKLNVDHRMFSPGFFRESLTNFRGWIDDLLVLAWEHCKDADVLVESPSAMAGVHIAEALKIPYFRAFTMPWSKTTQFPHPFISPPVANNAKFNIASYSLFDNVFWLGTSSQINRWRKKHLGLPVTDMGHLAQEKIPFLYNFSPSVVPKPSEWGDQLIITGYWFLDNPDLGWTPSKELVEFIEQAHAEHKPLVYIGFGSITVPSPSETTRNIVKAVLKSDVRAILSKGWSSRMHKDSDVDVEIPSQIFLIDKAPHDWLFAQMAAVVHHGGAGTTGASLRAGVPTIIKPWFGDQFFWASRVQRLGVGLKLSSLSSGELAEALKKATTDIKMQEKAALLGERIRAEDGVTTAIRSIYTYLHRAGKDRKTL